MKSTTRSVPALLAVAALCLGGLSACGTEYDYAKSDAGKYDRPYVDPHADPADEKKSDDEDEG